MGISSGKQNIESVFCNGVYLINFYQRDYKWTSVPVQRLLNDIVKTNMTTIFRQNGVIYLRSRLNETLYT